jgi:acetyl-CoA carboxylase biotin carboxylase subunit
MATSGLDLVQWQIRLARGERLALSSHDTLTPSGHAIECRVYAEDPDMGFLPSPGRIVGLRAPDGPGVRDDGWVEAGTEVPIYYDSLLSKVIVWGGDRTEALARMRRALSEYEIRGVRSTLSFSRWLLARREFAEARFHTAFLDELLQERGGEPFGELDPSLEEVAAVAACLAQASVQLTAAGGARQSGMSIESPSVAERDGDVISAERSWKVQARRESLRG